MAIASTYTTQTRLHRQPLAGPADGSDPVAGPACEIRLFEPDAIHVQRSHPMAVGWPSSPTVRERLRFGPATPTVPTPWPLTAFGGPLDRLTSVVAGRPIHRVRLPSGWPLQHLRGPRRGRAGSGVSTPVLRTAQSPQWSIDGKWLYFRRDGAGASNRYSRSRLKVANRRSSPRRAAHVPARRRSDGRIYYSKNGEIWSVSTAGGDERRLIGIPSSRRQSSMTPGH